MEVSYGFVEVSYEMRDLIAREMKSFSDGEFLKRGILIAVNALCPEKIHLFSNISLSRHTVTRRIEDMVADVKQTFGDICQEFQYFSLALNESTDEKDTEKLAKN